MPDLDFHVENAQAVPYAVAPLLNFLLRITDRTPVPEDRAPRTIHTVALRCQIRIEPAQRPYKSAEKDRLVDLFGEPARWGQTLRPMLWTHTSLIVPQFAGSTTVELPVPCTYDFNLAAARFFHALEDGEVPLRLFFSGTIFHAAEDESLQVAQISWDKETPFRLPVKVWKDMMELYYPNCAWLCLRKDTFDDLSKFKSKNGIPTWEAALEILLATRAVRTAEEPA